MFSKCNATQLTSLIRQIRECLRKFEASSLTVAFTVEPVAWIGYDERVMLTASAWEPEKIKKLQYYTAFYFNKCEDIFLFTGVYAITIQSKLNDNWFCISVTLAKSGTKKIH